MRTFQAPQVKAPRSATAPAKSNRGPSFAQDIAARTVAVRGLDAQTSARAESRHAADAPYMRKLKRLDAIERTSGLVSQGISTAKIVIVALIIAAVALGGITGIKYVLETFLWYHWAGIIIILLAVWRRL